MLVIESNSFKVLLHTESNTDRDIVAILVRSFVQAFKADPQAVRAKAESEFYARKQALWEQELK